MPFAKLTADPGSDDRTCTQGDRHVGQHHLGRSWYLITPPRRWDGWGPVLVFLVLGLTAILSTEVMGTCSAYVATNLIGWATIVPLVAALFAFGVGRTWG